MKGLTLHQWIVQRQTLHRRIQRHQMDLRQSLTVWIFFSTASRGEKWSGFKEGGETEAEKPFKPSTTFTPGPERCPNRVGSRCRIRRRRPPLGPPTGLTFSQYKRWFRPRKVRSPMNFAEQMIRNMLQPVLQNPETVGWRRAVN